MKSPLIYEGTGEPTKVCAVAIRTNQEGDYASLVVYRKLILLMAQ
jgi:hypothetical protein